MIAIEIARALRLVFLLASAAPIGAVLLLAIARLTGADWRPLSRLTTPLPVLAALGALAMLAGSGAPLPAHLAVWEHPLFVAVRALVAVGALALAVRRIRAGEGAAGVTLALYAALVTPIAADWLLGGDPGHPVSAIGMMLFVQQIGGACAAALLLGWGPERMRSDMGKLLVAAALGLGYLAFMDFLIVWYGNLPQRVPFYLARATPATAALAGAALLAGLAGPIAALTLLPGERGQRLAGVTALLGLALFDWWWLGGGLLAALAPPVAAGLMLAFARWERAHG